MTPSQRRTSTTRPRFYVDRCARTAAAAPSASRSLPIRCKIVATLRAASRSVGRVSRSGCTSSISIAATVPRCPIASRARPSSIMRLSQCAHKAGRSPEVQTQLMLTMFSRVAEYSRGGELAQAVVWRKRGLGPLDYYSMSPTRYYPAAPFSSSDKLSTKPGTSDGNSSEAVSQAARNRDL